MNDMLMAYRLTDATLEDLPAIVDIYNTTIPGRLVTADMEPITPDSRLSWFHEHSPDQRPLWVLKNGQELAAWLSLQHFHPRAAYSGTAEVSIYLAESYRSQGIGAQLLQKAFEACPRLDIHSLVALVFGHNIPSLRLFERCGFEQWGRLPGVAVLDGVSRDLIIAGRKV